MDLNRVPNDQKLIICRNYFRIGFFLLPFVWLVNAVWFFREAFIKPEYNEQKQIRKYVILSGIGATVMITGLLSWVIVFQTQRVAWGEMGDRISYLVPRGRP